MIATYKYTNNLDCILDRKTIWGLQQIYRVWPFVSNVFYLQFTRLLSLCFIWTKSTNYNIAEISWLKNSILTICIYLIWVCFFTVEQQQMIQLATVTNVLLLYHHIAETIDIFIFGSNWLFQFISHLSHYSSLFSSHAF